MSMGVIPEDGEISIGLLPIAGRQLHARCGNGEPVAWISNRNVPSPGSMWADLSEQSGETGLQPFLLGVLEPLMDYPPSEPGRPWDSGEVNDPVDLAVIDTADPAALLADWWYWDEEEREALTPMYAPFGARFPGLAPATTAEIDPELRRRALHQYTRTACMGLVPADRPADILARVGWDRRRHRGQPLLGLLVGLTAAALMTFPVAPSITIMTMALRPRSRADRRWPGSS